MRRLISAVALAVLPAAASGQYKITHTYTVGGDGSWDYVIPDTTNHRLFIGRQNRVMVVDENDEADRRGDRHSWRAGGPSPLRQDMASRARQRIVMFELKLPKSLGRAHAAEDADAIIYDAASNRVFSFNGAHSSTVVDRLWRTRQHHSAASPVRVARRRKVYANLTDVSEVVEIDKER
jgi:hypothetical protein